MLDEKPDIILESKEKSVKYYMYKNRIIVKSNNDDICIELPQVENVICFYDMYFVKECINVIIATRGSYDIRYILDENEIKLVSKKLSK